jgi:hypothetical protein
MEFVKIVIMGVVAACVYGIVQDQVTARVCVEYFTIGHPPIFHTDSPTLLALGWGVIATWWVGLPLGLLMGLASRVGGWPRLTWRNLLRPVAIVLCAMGFISLSAGVAGYFAAKADWVWLGDPLWFRVPPERHALFLADLWAHLAAYGSGFLGGLGLCIWGIVARGRRAVAKAREAKEAIG